MKLVRLRIAGFKSFVEPADFVIEPGLTGVVGPNGCGKSNLVEALRWVMGESSHKNLRASGMEDVIFAGSGGRPARNMAEVTLVLDNAARTAPAAFNDTDMLEVSRRIERDEGSVYRVNGREVRQRDVQLLFADAATGARSSALVRQGQIGELIAARPQARRRILEDAAGIAGLYSRRHEAELRLKAAEDNLVRLEDVLREIEAQGDSLRKQAKQAARYRAVSADIRTAEAVLAALAWHEAQAQAVEAGLAVDVAIRSVTDATRQQAEAARRQAVAAAALEPLRQSEAEAAAGLQRLTLARDALAAEEARAAGRVAELDRRAAEARRDAERETAAAADAEAALARLIAEEADLTAAGDAAQGRAEAVTETAASAERALAEAESRLAALQTQAADRAARRAAAERAHADEEARAARLAQDETASARDLAALDAQSGAPGQADEARAALVAAEAAAVARESEAQRARSALAIARETEATARSPASEAERTVQRLDTEIRTLATILAPATGDLWPPVLDRIGVEPGYETALGAALGEDLDAALDPSAPVHWREGAPAFDDPALPDGATPLLAVTQAPAALARRLAQIGVVAREAGPELASALRPGQRLVSREGDLWRWDGFTAAAEAPSAAARRLAERNRLAGLEREVEAARAAALAAKMALDAAQAAVRTAAHEETRALDAAAAARRTVDAARAHLAGIERRLSESAARRAALVARTEQLAADRAETETRRAAAREALAAFAPDPQGETALAVARAAVAERRASASETRAAVQTLQREADLRARRLAALAEEGLAWRARAARAAEAREELASRLAAIDVERADLTDAPERFRARRVALLSEIDAAEAARRAAADALTAAQADLATADAGARAGLEALSQAREARAAAEARREAAQTRLATVARSIEETFGLAPADLLRQSGEVIEAARTDREGLERRLAGLKQDRERLGAVNLRAEDELAETLAKRDALVAERDDLVEAIRRLRQAIGSLNREGRERLLAAFSVVDSHFRRLFAQLFGGGEAELTLVDSDDPLEAGLEILARPPGKKPQILTLLSGGEQALTATALIFAVFLTNPSPVCVLDEVDAPLDDANVERYCDLLAEMARDTATRFIVITHNPITMARMDRLFGVTMAERGVSTLVSVDLQTAEALREAG